MSNTRRLDAEWFETCCPECGHKYLWHCDEHNQCTRCGADYGPLIRDLKAYLKEIRARIRRDYLRSLEQLDDKEPGLEESD